MSSQIHMHWRSVLNKSKMFTFIHLFNTREPTKQLQDNDLKDKKSKKLSFILRTNSGSNICPPALNSHLTAYATDANSWPLLPYVTVIFTKNFLVSLFRMLTYR